MEAQILGPVAACLLSLGSIVITAWKVRADFKKELEAETSKAIKHAKEITQKELETISIRLDGLSKDMSNLDDKFKAEVSHIRDTYNNEIRNLGAKIEELREEVRTSTSQMLSLLTKLIENKD